MQVSAAVIYSLWDFKGNFTKALPCFRVMVTTFTHDRSLINKRIERELKMQCKHVFSRNRPYHPYHHFTDTDFRVEIPINVLALC